jgi:hypothetical protein
MLGNDHFYNRTIRKVIVAFGSIFNDITLVRYSKDGSTAYERTKVPISYGAKEKYLLRLTSDPTLTKSIAEYVPRISFDLSGLAYDSTRKFITVNKNYGFDTSTGMVKGQFAPVPYTFDFDLSIYVRNTEDGTQILEQILPYFTPDFTVTVDFIHSIGRKYDMPIMLNSVTPEVDYEGDMMTTRLIIWNLSFTARGYIFPAVSSTGVIEQANTNIYTDIRATTTQQVYIDPNSGRGVYTTGEIVRVLNKGKTGTVAYFANNSTGSLVVSNLTDLLEENEIITGDYSGASYTINTVDLNPIKTVALVTIPDPTTATPNTSYGYTTDITEYPSTLEDQSINPVLATEYDEGILTEASEPIITEQ